MCQAYSLCAQTQAHLYSDPFCTYRNMIAYASQTTYAPHCLATAPALFPTEGFPSNPPTLNNISMLMTLPAYISSPNVFLDLQAHKSNWLRGISLCIKGQKQNSQFFSPLSPSQNGSFSHTIAHAKCLAILTLLNSFVSDLLS